MAHASVMTDERSECVNLFGSQDICRAAVDHASERATFVQVGSCSAESAACLAATIASAGKHIRFHRLTSTEPAKGFDDESIDFVFLGPADNYERVRADVRTWYEKVKPGGIVAGDNARLRWVRIGVNETIPESQYRLSNDETCWWHRKQSANYGAWIRRDVAQTDLLVYVPYVNNFLLLDKAVRSLRPLWSSLIVIDQSEEGLNAPWAEELSGIYRIPFQAISFTQMMNWARGEAFDRHAGLLAFVHSDAQCSAEEVGPSIIAASRAHLGEKIGVNFTNYDAFAVFNTESLRDIGPWDESFRWYLADNDYYYRLRLLGWGVSELGGDQVRHCPSQTLRNDPRIRAAVESSWNWHVRHYQHKWGGPPGRETFRRPYNGCP